MEKFPIFRIKPQLPVMAINKHIELKEHKHGCESGFKGILN